MMAAKKVLVVDDEIHIVHVVACSEKPDIIVTDFQMPVMTGLELVEKIRQNQDTKNIPVILLTARNFAIEDEQKESLQISDCLSKPFSPKELLRSIQDVLYQETVLHGN
ncbi:MAG: response regulator [Planctomycetota bacterium]|jgi:CheY-like chemotaxis protein